MFAGVKKKVEAAGKRKNCAVLCDWSQSISNHLYFCAASSQGDGELLEQMWRSLLNHVVDIHEGHGNRYPKCQHGELEDRAWIKRGIFKRNFETQCTCTCSLLHKFPRL